MTKLYEAVLFTRDTLVGIVGAAAYFTFPVLVLYFIYAVTEKLLG